MDIPAEVRAYADADFAEVNDAFVARLVELAGGIPEAEALDLGTGPGDIPVRVARVLPGWNITAVDVSPEMLDVAEQAIAAAGLDDRIGLLQADAKATGLGAGSFDVILSNSILHHINATGAFWNELRRLAKPGAVLLLRDLARPDSREAARAVVDEHAADETTLLKEEFFRSLLAAYTVGEVKEQLRTAGLTGLVVEQVTDRHLDVHGRF
jgi:ubiquinone/menaquinone biosynthesis C-methylase UbiE